MATKKLFRGRIFQEKDLQLLLELTVPVSSKPRAVGLALGFLNSELDAIEATVSSAVEGPQAWFRKMLSQWLKWAPPNHDFPSSSSLAKALRSPTVKEEVLAYNLEQYFSKAGTQETETVKPSMPVAASSSLLPGNSGCSHAINDSQDTVMVKAPPVAESAAPDDSDNDDPFFDAEDTETMKISPTPKTPSRLELGLHDFVLSEEELERLAEEQRRQQEMLAEGDLWWLVASEEQRRRQERLAEISLRWWLIPDLIKKCEAFPGDPRAPHVEQLPRDPCAPLVQSYLELTESVKEALKERGITAREIRDALLEHSQDESRAYMKRVMKVADDLQEDAKIQEVLDTMTPHSSLPDHKPLEHLIKTFNLKEVEEKLERYKKALWESMQLMMESSVDPAPPPRKKSRVGPDPEVRKNQCTTT